MIGDTNTVDLAGLGRTLDRAAREATLDALPQLLASIEATKAIAWARLVAPPTTVSQPIQSTSSTADELSLVYHVPKSWFYEMARRGHLPCMRLGRYVRFDRAEVEAALAKDSKMYGLATGKKRSNGKPSNGPATALLPRGEAGCS